MLEGKVCVVTGGSRGIGRAVVLKMAENGADVALLYAGEKEKAEQVAAEAQALGVRARAYQCDVADFHTTTTTFRQIIEDFGTIDILVNNAGVTKDKLLLSMEEEDFDRVIAVNLKGAFNAIKQVYSVFAKKKAGKIINISSVAGLTGNPGQANYAAAKAGLIGLTKTVARELASRRICCNAVAPGFISTDMTQSFSENTTVIHNIPAKRFGTPEEVASVVVFLASPQADYITGEVIRVDGGLSV